MAQQARPPTNSSSFPALAVPEFRTLWLGQIFSAIGTWMQIVALSLLVLKLSGGSTAELGVVSLVQALAFFAFALPGGSVADRFDKRRLLMVTQTTQGLLAALLGVLTASGHISLWSVIGLAFVSSAVLSVDQPTRSALATSLVPRELLTSAVSLNSVVFNGAAVLGPALAGILVARAGLGSAFYANALSYGGVLLSLALIRSRPASETSSKGNFLESLREAFRAVRRQEALPWVMGGYAALLFFGPSTSLILPVLATKILHLPESDLGFLFSAAGVGTVLGGLLLSRMGLLERRGLILLSSLFAWVGSLVLLALSRSLGLSMLALFIFGFAQTWFGTLVVALLQGSVGASMRGRVMSLNTLLIMGVRPMGDFPAGLLIGALGVPGVVLLSAGLVGGFGLLLARQSSVNSL